MLFNDLLGNVRTKKMKGLGEQRLQYLTERQNSLNDFLQKSEGQLKVRREYTFYGEQIVDEENKLAEFAINLTPLNKVWKKSVTHLMKRSAIDIIAAITGFAAQPV